MHPAPHRSARRWAVLPLLLALAFALSGCVRVRAAMSVGSDDLVSGKLEIASLQTKPDDPGPQLTVPTELTDKVRLTPYEAEGFVGRTLEFDKLSFEQTRVLSDSISTISARYRLNFRRSGDIVSLSGSMDLTQVPADRLDVQLKVAFPGQIGKTNGSIDKDNTITWTAKAGAVTEFSATAQYSDASGLSWTRWVLMVGAGAVGAALLVLVLALVAHRRSIRQQHQSHYV